MATATGPPGSAEADDGADPPRVRDGDGPTVAVFDDSTRSALYRRWLPDAIEVVTVQSIGEGRRVVDGSTAVALVRHELSESKRGAVADLLDEQSPLVRTVLTTSRHEPVADRVLDENATLCEPIDRDSLRQVVSRQVAMASYGRLLVQYYECTTRLSSREVELRGDSCDDERYQRLESRREDLAAGIKTLQKRLSAEALRSVLYEIAPPEQERVAREREPPTSGKYRPDGCRSCGRNWNVNPDGSPAGYRRLGAFVWECTDCGTLHDRSDPVNQRVARRR